MIHEGILEYRKSRYFWFTVLLITVSIALYLTQVGIQPPNGGTWQGYILGSIGAVLIIWLSLLGVRKRSYHSSMGSVAAWTSLHIYLGTALLIVATLHSAGHFGWNIHSLTYVIMCVVIFSGFLGLYYYISFPQKVLENRDGRSRDELFEELQELNEAGAQLANRCSAEVSEAANSAISRTRIGGGVVAQLRRSDRSNMTIQKNGSAQVVENHDQRRVLALISRQIPNAVRSTEVEPLHELMSVMGRRQAVIRRIVRDIQLQGLMQIWLFIHIPLSIILIISLFTHILSTFLYW